MPRINEQSNVFMGVGGLPGSLNGTLIPDSTGPQWYNYELGIFQQPSTGKLVSYNINSGIRLEVASRGANDLRAGGNVWAAWLSGYGLYSSTGVYLPDAGLLDVGPDGAIGFTPNRQSGIGADVLEIDGEIWRLTDGIVYDLQLLGQHRAIWRDEGHIIHTYGIPSCIQIGSVWRPRAVKVDGTWFVCYFSDLVGVVLHPFDSTEGWVIAPPGVDAFQHDMIAIGIVIELAWSARAGELPEDLRERAINTFTEPRVQLIPTIKIPAINKPCWLGWFEFIEPTIPFAPSNCILRVRTEPGTIRELEGNQFALWVQSLDGTVESIEQQAANSGHPTVCYWDGRDWPRLPNLPLNAWLGLQAYCKSYESPEKFELIMRSYIEGIYLNYPKIALVCQCYTSNDSLTKDIRGVVPVYARLARDYPRINMLLAFSDQGRATGYNDHPEVRSLWQDLFNGITGEPTMSNGVVNGVLVDPQAYFFSLVAGKNPTNYIDVLNEIGPDLYKYGLGQQKDSGCTPRARLFLPTGNAGCINAAPDNTPLEQCLGVKQHPPCWEHAVDVVDSGGSGGWVWVDRGGPAYVPISAPEPEPSLITILILAFDSVVGRSNPNGMLIRFEVASARPIVQIELDLEGDGEPSIVNNLLNEPRRDGRYLRALAFKPTVNGTWPLRVKAKDDLGNVGQSNGTHMVTVTF